MKRRKIKLYSIFIPKEILLVSNFVDESIMQSISDKREFKTIKKAITPLSLANPTIASWKVYAFD